MKIKFKIILLLAILILGVGCVTPRAITIPIPRDRFCEDEGVRKLFGGGDWGKCLGIMLSYDQIILDLK